MLSAWPALFMGCNDKGTQREEHVDSFMHFMTGTGGKSSPIGHEENGGLHDLCFVLVSYTNCESRPDSTSSHSLVGIFPSSGQSDSRFHDGRKHTPETRRTTRRRCTSCAPDIDFRVYLCTFSFLCFNLTCITCTISAVLLG